MLRTSPPAETGLGPHTFAHVLECFTSDKIMFCVFEMYFDVVPVLYLLMGAPITMPNGVDFVAPITMPNGVNLVVVMFCFRLHVVLCMLWLMLSAGVWLHGEAVAAGMVMAADMSHRLGWIDEKIMNRTRSLLQRANLPVVPPKVSFCIEFCIVRHCFDILQKGLHHWADC